MESELQINDLVLSIKNAISYLLQKWLQILSISLIFGLLFICYIWMQDAKYTAEITFVSENDKSSSLGGYASIAAQFGFDIGGGARGSIFEGENLLGLLKSKRMIEMTLLSKAGANKSLLIDDYMQNHQLRKKWKNSKAIGSIIFDTVATNNTRAEDSILIFITTQIIKKQLTVEKIDKKLDLISMRFTDNNEVFAKLFLEKLTENAIQFYTNYKTQKGVANVNVLQHQTDSVRTMLFGGISDIAATNDLNVNPLKQIVKVSSQKKQADIQVNTLLYGELLKNLELAKLSLRKETPLVQIIDSPRLPLKNEKLGRLMGGILGAFFGGFVAVLFFLFKRNTSID